LVSPHHFSRKGTRTFGEVVDSKARSQQTQDKPGISMLPENKNIIKKMSGSRESRKQPEGATKQT
jgi:hypothetical protein